MLIEFDDCGATSASPEQAEAVCDHLLASNKVQKLLRRRGSLVRIVDLPGSLAV